MRPNPAKHPGFAQWGGCARCGVIGGLDDGLCVVCFDDPLTVEEPVTEPASVTFELVLQQCALCGADHEVRDADLCNRCLAYA